MKNWVVFGLVAIGGYWMYSSWFASDEPARAQPENTEQLASEEDTNKAAPAGGDKVDATKPLRLDLTGDKEVAGPSARPRAPDPSRKLHEQRKKALDDGNATLAKSFAQRILAKFPDSDAARWVHFERGRAALQDYRALKWKKEGLKKANLARKELTYALFLSDADPAEREDLREVLAELAKVVVFSPRHINGADFSYTPKRGANLDSLCRNVFPSKGARVSPGLVAEVNRLRSPNHLRAMEPIKVPLGEPRIIIVKSEYRLYFLLDGAYVRDFPVGLGREDSTPETSFRIVMKQKKPDWYPEAGKRIRYGDPRNILGTRWLGFNKTPTYTGYGIHGSSDPMSIGKQASSGCIRMLRADVERLFGWTPLRTRVDIVP